MMILFTLCLVCCFLSFSLLYAHKTRRHNLCLIVEDDSDVKIAGQSGSILPEPSENNNQSAMEFFHQKENGNIEKARTLGKQFASLLLGEDGSVNLTSKNFIISKQKKVLFSFVVNYIVEHFSPNSILAHTILNTFYDYTMKMNKNIYDIITDSGAFSMYIFSCSKTPNPAEQAGAIFKQLCPTESLQDLSVMGKELFLSYFSTCKSKMNAVQFQ